MGLFRRTARTTPPGWPWWVYAIAVSESAFLTVVLVGRFLV